MANENPVFLGITDEEAKECATAFNEGGLQAFNEIIKQKRDKWKTIPLNIGIAGSSGSGKSSFINTLRDLTADDEGAAKTGITETTTEPTPYKHPNNEQLKLWDLPGVGTPKFTRETYLSEVGFEKFDFFLIMTSTRFTDNDKWLANEIHQRGKQFFFVRTKIAIDIQNHKHDYPRTHKQIDVLSEIRSNIEEHLGALYDDKNVFLIDNHECTKYDFDQLKRRIIEEFPDIKRDALILSLSALSESMIKEKAKTLKKYVWISCISSAAVALIPIPGTSIGFDGVLAVALSSFFFHQFGLDEQSLNRTAKMASCDTDILQEIVDNSVKSLLKKEGITVFVNSIPLASLLIAEEGFRFIPILGSVLASIISFGTTYAVSIAILNKMEEVALRVVKVAIENKSTYHEEDDASEQ